MFILCVATKRFNIEDKHLIKKGCTKDKNGVDITTYDVFSKLDKALDSLSKHKTHICRLNDQYIVSEYYIWQPNGTLDPNDGKILEYSDMVITVKESGNYGAVTRFENFKDAEDFINKQDNKESFFIL